VTSFCGAIEHLKERDTAVTVILAPTHRSFFDFLLVSYAFFALPELQINIPFIAAADVFEELPVLGRLAGILGAFFVKRGKRTKDPALREAIRTLPPNASIEVFIEGTRSRDRRFVEPKTGFLRCLQSTDEPYLIIPISISYEALPDQGSLASEARGEQSSGLSSSGLLCWLQVRR
jgi:1-acyl-sn-glycerol-3-phosphate acyltransferase